MKKQVIAYLHTHWDREWYREFEVFRMRLLRVFDNVLDMLERNKIMLSKNKPKVNTTDEITTFIETLKIQVDRLDFDSLGSNNLKMDLLIAIQNNDFDKIVSLLSKLEEIAAHLESDDYAEINTLFSKAKNLKRLVEICDKK